MQKVVTKRSSATPPDTVDLPALRHSQWRQEPVGFALVIAFQMIMSRELRQCALQWTLAKQHQL